MKKSLIVTSISPPNAVLQSLANGALKHAYEFIIIGDTKSPDQFELDGANFVSIEKQKEMGFRVVNLLQERSYARKNIGYLMAMRSNAGFIIETDDDNYPREDFWQTPDPTVQGNTIETQGWCNVYRLFSEDFIWPRGYPIERLANEESPAGRRTERHCPIQQGLADDNPDVDAIYRMTRPLPITFKRGEPVILGSNVWCPFNSQNTIHFPEAYILLYLPTYCSFRMTDIWRSFVSQRILWTCGWNLSFHQASVWQERNAHNLLNDFKDEVPGYLNNHRIAQLLEELSLKPGQEHMGENLIACYQALVDQGFVGESEIPLVKAWVDDCTEIQQGPSVTD